MHRSFRDRVFGGVCGGLAESLRLSAWALRWLLALLTVVSLGVGAAAYLALWWALPQESPLEGERGGNALGVVAVLLILLGTFGAWAGHVMGWLRGPEGQVILLPVVLVVLSVVFLFRELRGA